MPPPLKGINWEEAMLLRMQGLTFDEIGRALGVKPGTVAVRSHRERWDEKLAAAKHKVSSGVIEQTAKVMQERAKE